MPTRSSLPKDHQGSVLYLPHGGGPMPLLEDEQHRSLNDFLRRICTSLIKPSAILLISAHWEAQTACLTSGSNPRLIYDYKGFPAPAYQIKYPAPGEPQLAQTVQALLEQRGIECTLDSKRGFDHGMFVPLKIMFPEATIPCVQLSLLNNMDPQSHIDMGRALQTLKAQNVLIIGSGFSFHNLPAVFASTGEHHDPRNDAFHDWLTPACVGNAQTNEQKTQNLVNWQQAPYARYCHPREEHLLPLHVCFGAATTAGHCVFDDKILGKRSTAYLW